MVRDDDGRVFGGGGRDGKVRPKWNMLTQNMHGRRYYWEYIKRFGKESSETWLKDFVIAFLLAIIPVFLAWGDRTVLQGALLAVEAIGLLFGVVALRHLVHTSLILFRERAHPEYGGIRYTHWGYGAWGAAILLVLIAGITYGASHEWVRKLPPVVLHVPPPITPTIVAAQAVSPRKGNAARDTKTMKPPARTDASQTPTPNIASQTPPRMAPQVPQSSPPPTFLNRVVQENRGLTPGDRNRLSDELYAADKFLKQSQAVGYKLNSEFGRLSNDRQSGTLAKNVDDHIKFVKDLDTAGWDQYHGLQKFQSEYQYFSDQTQYIFGDNPFNAGEGLLLTAISGMTIGLTSWSKITNRDQREILNLESQFQSDCEMDLRHFFEWVNVSLQRITQMRQSLDPNGVVQPLPTNRGAPAPAMFL